MTRFRVGPPIGQGRFGVVHRAYDRTTDAWVAWKTAVAWKTGVALETGSLETGSLETASLETGPLETGPATDALRDEHDKLARVSHPHVVRAIVFEEGPPAAFAMELAEGPDLVRWARRDVPREAPRVGVRRNLPMAFGYELQEEGRSAFAPITHEGATRLRDAIAKLASALLAIHEAGLLHLDVSAANVRMVRRAGRDEPVLIDLGLAWDRALGSTREVAGAAASLAPELGLSAPTEAADAYGLGVLLFEALTGKLPFDGGGMEVLVRKQSIEAPRASEVAPGVPDDLDALCAGLLMRSPRERLRLEDVHAAIER